MFSVLRALFLATGACMSAAMFAQAPAQPAANSDPTYQQLRNIGLGTDVVTVSNFDLKRDAATFHLRSGKICFLAPVQGKVTGAVFEGEGSMSLTPPLPVENKMLKLFTKEDVYNETFNRLVLRFTDGSYDELKKAGASTPGGCDGGPLKESQDAQRWKIRYNITGRILEDVLSPEPGGLFVAFVHGKRYDDKQLFVIDPHGAPIVEPEEVSLLTYNENKEGIWAAFHFSNEYQKGTASGTERNASYHISNQQLDTTIEKNAYLVGKAATTVVSQMDGLRVVPFNLFPTLRVQKVTAENGTALSFIQEDKLEDPQFFVILPEPLAKNAKYTITTNYEGKDALSNLGSGNYFLNPGARESWYPNSFIPLGEYSTFDMEFRIPKGMKIAAAGSQVSDDNTGSQNVTQWKSAGPQTVVAFNFGRFKMQETKLDKPPMLIQSYANEELPDVIKNFLHVVRNDLPDQRGQEMAQVDLDRDPSQSARSEMSMGTMTTTPLIKKALSEGDLSVQLYTDYYGPVAFKSLALTQQTACNFGQSWPGLVWIPMCYFYDTTVRHQMKMDDDRGYWRAVTPHEVAHQWWGHQVGFVSYRDQWMSEGFAEMSAGLYLQMVEKNPKKFIQFWNEERELVLDHNEQGFRGIDMPITLGYRANNFRSGANLTRFLIYPKGAYILHMIRMMMWNVKTGDQLFKDTMQDFVRTYSGRAATTEDFKAIVEKHMTPEMVALADGKNNMDWFFNEYVYGTALPAYKLDYSFVNGADGKPVFDFKLTQSGVDNTFRMPVPIYFELEDGRTIMLGRVRLTGNTTVSQQVSLGALKPKRAVVNYHDDVLASPN